MDKTLAVRAVALYVPILFALALVFWRRPSGRVLTGALLAFIWNLVWLVPLGRVAEYFGWFSFASFLPNFLGMPIDLWLGWALFWGAIPILLAPSRSWVLGLAVVWLDLALMPQMEPVVHLGQTWLVGELVGAALCLFPGLALGTWTANDRRLAARTCLQVAAFTALVVGLIPLAVIETRNLILPSELQSSLLVKGFLLFLFGIPLILGASAVQEFVERGKGTPLPLDPPRVLVASGPYAYVANPMQLSITLVLGVLAVALRDEWFALGSAIAVAFSAGLAEWNENAQLRSRFGDRWLAYRSGVRNWWPRWTPIYSELTREDSTSQLYFAMTCDQCRSVGDWIARADPTGLEFVPAETSPIPLRRMTYVGYDGTRATGVAAFGRALEHINLGWAMLGWLIRLPILNPLIQLIVDASGGGPRDVPFGCSVDTRRNAA